MDYPRVWSDKPSVITHRCVHVFKMPMKIDTPLQFSILLTLVNIISRRNEKSASVYLTCLSNYFSYICHSFVKPIMYIIEGEI